MAPTPTSTDDLKRRFAVQPLKVVATTRQLFAARFSTCGSQLVSGGYDGLIHRWDARGGSFPELPALSGHGGWVQAVEWHPGETKLYSGDSWGQLCGWALSHKPADTPEPTWSVADAHDGWIHALAVSPDGSWLASVGRDKAVRTWSTATGKPLAELLGHELDVLSVAITPDGQILSGDLQGDIRQWDPSTGKTTRRFDAAELHSRHRLQDVGGARRLVLTPSGDELLACGTRPKNGGNVQGVPLILRFDWKSGKQTGAIELGATSQVYVTDLFFHPGGFAVISTSGGPGTGQLLFRRLDDKESFYSNTRLANCHAVSLRPGDRQLAITTTSRGSNGNGRRLNKAGEYAGNSSPIHVLEFPAPLQPPAVPLPRRIAGRAKS